MEARQNQLQRSEEEIKKCEQQLRETRVSTLLISYEQYTHASVHVQAMHERALSDNNLHEQRFAKLKVDYENQLTQSDQLAGQNTQMEMMLRKKDEEVSTLKQEVVRGNKVKDGLQRKLRTVEAEKTDIESKRESLKMQINSLERGVVPLRV